MTYIGVARGNTIEFDEPLPYQDGQSLEVTVELLATTAPAGSIEAILRAMSAPPHLMAEDVDDLLCAIEASRLPVHHKGLFERVEGLPGVNWSV